jgi:hypothetical protein
VRFCAEPLEQMRSALLDHLRSGGEDTAVDGDGWRRYPPMSMPANPDALLGHQDAPWADTSIPGYTDR